MNVSIYALAGALCCVNVAVAEGQPPLAGTITRLVVHTSTHTTQELRGTMVFQLSDPAVSGCTWFYVKADDKTTSSTALAAKLADRVVTIYYDDALPPPWGDPSTCAATAIEVSG